MRRVFTVSVNCKTLLHAVHYTERNSSGLYSERGPFNLHVNTQQHALRHFPRYLQTNIGQCQFTTTRRYIAWGTNSIIK